MQKPVLRKSNSDTSIKSKMPPAKARLTQWFSLDLLGICASTICMIHCLATPVLLASLPLLGFDFLESDLTHKALAFFVLAFALLAVVPAYFKHRSFPVLLGIILGLTLVLVATFCCSETAWEIPLISTGNIIIVLTHFRNRRLSLACKCS